MIYPRSQKVAEKLALDLKGKIKLEDAGFDWKVNFGCLLVNRAVVIDWLKRSLVLT